MNTEKEVLEKLRDISQQAQFVSFTYKAKGTGELARHTLIFGVSYLKQIEHSLLALRLLEPTCVTAVQKQAFKELEESLLETIQAFKEGRYNRAYTKPNAYFTLCNGMKYCINMGTINVSGLAHAKVVLEKGLDKNVQHSLLTLAKKELKSQLPVDRWKEFIVKPENLQSVRLQGVELILN